MASLFFIGPFYMNYVLPLVLVFTLMFAILERTKILGEDKRKINAVVSLVIGLVLISNPYTSSIVVGLMPYLAVVAVILLVFMVLYGFVSGKEKDVLEGWMKVVFGILIAIGLVVVLLYLTGFWQLILDFFYLTEFKSYFFNAVVLLIIIGAVILVVRGGSGNSETSSK